MVTPYLRSYGRRKGRDFRPNQKELLDTLFPQLSIVPVEDGQIDPMSFFASNIKEAALEIGFGGGEHLEMQARLHPEIGFIGCEPYMNGIVKLLQSIEEDVPKNLRIYNDDVRDLIAHFKAESLAKIYLLFPDPWPKKRHNKRRLVSDEMLGEFSRLLKPGAEVLVATDHQDYARWIIRHFANHNDFAWQAKSKSDWQTPPEHWVETRYQQKAKKQGREAVFFLFQKKDA